MYDGGMNKIKKELTWLPAIFMMCLIFAFSSQDGETSGFLSRSLSAAIMRAADDFLYLEPDYAEEEEAISWFEIVLRKGAHFTEYLLLAVFHKLFD